MKKIILTVLIVFVCVASLWAENTDNALRLSFRGTDNPIETEHQLIGTHITFSEDGNQMTFTTNGASVTYDMNTLAGMSYFCGTPSVTLPVLADSLHAGDYYTTFFSGLESYTIPEGVIAYTATLNASNDRMTLTQVEGITLPQGEAVLLKSNSSDNLVMMIADSLVNTKSINNVLRGSDVYIPALEGYAYLLASEGKRLAFYQNSEAQIPANTAYVQLDTEVPAHYIAFLAGSPTFIQRETVNESTGADKFIQNGQLYIRKNGRHYNAMGCVVDGSL